jgi:hypothetical protein
MPSPNRPTPRAQIVDEELDAGLDGSHPVTRHAKVLRLERLNVKADLERELARLVLHRSVAAHARVAEERVLIREVDPAARATLRVFRSAGFSTGSRQAGHVNR